MRASWIGATLLGVCVVIVLTPQAKASPLSYFLELSGTGTATYSTSSDDPSFQARSGSGSATFRADADAPLGGPSTDVSISIPGAGVSISASGDRIVGYASVTGISTTGLGQIDIVAFNGDNGFGASSAFGEITLTPTSVTSQVEMGELFYTIASGNGVGDAKLIDVEPNSDPLGEPDAFTYVTTIKLDITSLTGSVVIPVLLPGAGSMLGAALVALGTLGYGLKRRRQPRGA